MQVHKCKLWFNIWEKFVWCDG